MNYWRVFWDTATQKEKDILIRKRSEKRKTHGLTNDPLYSVWRAMVARCHNPKHPRFEHWGGRGITVCREWRFSPVKFVEWGHSNGWEPGLEIDRENNNGNYTPKNCRFVTEKVQASNRRPRVMTEEGKIAISKAVAESNRRRAKCNVQI